MINLPTEIWIQILQDTDVKTVSAMACVNTCFRNIIMRNKYDIIDNLLNKGHHYLVPKNKETYIAYRYTVDLLSSRKQRQSLSTCLLNYVIDHLNIDVLCKNFKFEDEFLIANWSLVDTNMLLQYQRLPIQVLYTVAETINRERNHRYWAYMSRYQTLTIQFIDQYVEYVDWMELSRNKDSLTMQVIERYADKLIWPEVTTHGILESVIKRFKRHLTVVCWSNITFFTKLSDEFIVENLDKLQINTVLMCQSLQEETIENILHKLGEDENKVLWDIVAEHQALSREFIQKHKTRLPVSKLVSNRNVSKKALSIVFG